MRVWTIRHRRNTSWFLSKNGEIRDIPMIWKEREHAEAAIAQTRAIEIDWEVVAIQLVYEE